MNKLIKIYNCLLNPNYIDAYIKLVCPLFELKKALIETDKVKIIIDVGSNKGQFGLLARIFYPNCKIFSFEPQKKYLQIQKQILKKNIIFSNFCIGKKNEILTMNITKKEDSSSLLNPDILKKGIYEITYKKKVKVKTLNSIFKSIDLNNSLIKIDVQGYEYEVLVGAKKILNKIKYLIIEISNKKIYQKQKSRERLLKFLFRNNFKVVKKFNKSKLANDIYQYDYLLKNKIYD